MTDGRFHVAIVGGGLCGLALAIALTKRNVSYTIYESRGSFSEIGAGINLAPNSYEAFRSIDPSLADAVMAMGSRNPKGMEDVWMTVRLGAPTKRFEDAQIITRIMSPPIGSLTVGRNELLQTMAKQTPTDAAQFNKQLSGLDQSSTGVTLYFEDGSEAHASLVVGCDGAHSVTRRLMLGADHPAATAKYAQMGAYRTVLPIDQHVAYVGRDKAHSSNLYIGPRGYAIMYPISHGTAMNIGFWPQKSGEWAHDNAWVLPMQKEQMLKDFADWGPTTSRIQQGMGEDTPFWATHHHSVQPESLCTGRVLLIGDAAHAMGPHQGQGAAQAMEDALVLAQVLQEVPPTSKTIEDQQRHIEAALVGYENVRRPRAQRVLETSHENFGFWSTFWRDDLTEDDMEEMRHQLSTKYNWLWEADLAAQGRRAQDIMRQHLSTA